MSELYVGAYLVIPKVIKEQQRNRYICPTDIKHCNSTYSQNYCSVCGTKIEIQTDISLLYFDAPAIEDCPYGIQCPVLFGPDNKHYTFMVAQSDLEGEIYYASDKADEIELDYDKLHTSKERFQKEYQQFIEYLTNNQITCEIKTGILLIED